MRYKEVSITDNHRIPKAYRKGFRFYVNQYNIECKHEPFKPRFVSSNNLSKHDYYNIMAVQEEISEQEVNEQAVQSGHWSTMFNMKSNYVQFKPERAAKKDIRPKSQTDNTTEGIV